MPQDFAYIDAQNPMSELVKMSPVEMFDLDYGNVSIEWREEPAVEIPLS